MIRSMTGYGMSSAETPDFAVKAEIKSLNSKFADIKLKLPAHYFEKEIEIQKFIEKKLVRGKIDMILTISYFNADSIKRQINRDLFEAYLSDLESIAKEKDIQNPQMLNLILHNFPEVINGNGNTHRISEEEWKTVWNCLLECIENFDKFRLNEGAALIPEIRTYLKKIEQTVEQVMEIKDQRISVVRKRIMEKIKTNSEEALNPDRLEQELIYYLEKLDITEELERLKSHLEYFYRTLEVDYAGKKLTFISQEIGREINTMGAKANDFGIQKYVVVMKDELEKIKQQLSNIL